MPLTGLVDEYGKYIVARFKCCGNKDKIINFKTPRQRSEMRVSLKPITGTIRIILHIPEAAVNRAKL